MRSTLIAAVLAVSAFLISPALSADLPSACPANMVLVQVTNSNAVSAVGQPRACLRELNGEQRGGDSNDSNDDDSK